MFPAARLALRRSPAALPRAASLGLGAGLRQAAKDPFSRRLSPQPAPPAPLRLRIPLQIRKWNTKGVMKRRELIVLLTDALDTCEPAVRDRVSEKQRELQQVRQEYHAKTQVDARGATMSKTADGRISYTRGEFLSITVSCIFLGLALGELEQQLC